MNKVLAGVGIVAGVAACVGIWYAINSVDRTELPEWFGGKPAQTVVESQGKVWDKFVVVNELSQQDFSVWPGKLECDPWHRWEGFSRDKELMVSEGMVAYDNGDVQEFIDATQDGTVIPAKLAARFEWWRGEVNDTSVVMEGWYTAGNDELKELSMAGTLMDGDLYLEGERGPRTCRIMASRPE